MPKPSRKRKAPARLQDGDGLQDRSPVVGLEVPAGQMPQQQLVPGQASTALPMTTVDQTLQQQQQQHDGGSRANLVPNPQNPGTVQWPILPHASPIQGAASELGLEVQQSTKDKIAQGQYVDMSLLLPGKIDPPRGHKLGLSADGQFMITPAAGRKITTIEEWSDAFLVYSSLYLATHPSETQAVLKYFSTIRLAAKRHLGLGWQGYDTVCYV